MRLNSIKLSYQYEWTIIIFAARETVATLSECIAAVLSIIRLYSWFCKNPTCATLLDGTMVYRDVGHLLIAGSKMFAE